ncbi:hypothetical protein ACTMU2_11230 [Cupriavidus basilensis]
MADHAVSITVALGLYLFGVAAVCVGMRMLRGACCSRCGRPQRRSRRRNTCRSIFARHDTCGTSCGKAVRWPSMDPGRPGRARCCHFRTTIEGGAWYRGLLDQQGDEVRKLTLRVPTASGALRDIGVVAQTTRYQGSDVLLCAIGDA